MIIETRVMKSVLWYDSYISKLSRENSVAQDDIEDVETILQLLVD